MTTTNSRHLLLGVLVLALSTCLCRGQIQGVCDKPRNANQPFCDSSLSVDARALNLIASLTLDEKIGLLDHTANGASQMVDLDAYNWWSEALHGVAYSPGVVFRPPTEFATVFPQVINFASSFNKELFFEVGNATGNEARAFFNVGNAGLTFWSPNINIYRDPRWGRGHETPGEDPYLNKEFARAFVKGLQGEQENVGGFLKTSACCKHFSAHSLENDRFTFNAIVNEQDMADTYLPAFKGCVEEANVSCVMCAYNAVNGIPACADKGLLTGTVREKWGFDGYIVSDCAAVGFVYYRHNYTATTSETCRAVFDSGVDIECYAYDQQFYARNLRQAVDDGTVPVQMLDTALFRSFKVLIRLGYFEKDATRPYKDLVPSMVDSQPHQALALEAARQSIVLLKNAPNARSGQAPLPIDPVQFRAKRASMALIGPHVYGGETFLGNYHGNPSFIKEPIDEIRKYIPDVEFEFGCDVTSFDSSGLQAAEDLARASEQVVLFVGINAYEVELEERDRVNITLPGLQNELIRRVLSVVQEPVILFVVTGGAIDLSEWQNDSRVGAIILAGYLGQSGGEAMADVMFGVYNPSGRLTQTWYSNEYINQVSKFDMNMRPVGGSPGRTYRFFTGQPVYPFGFGLSYTTFQYAFDQLETSAQPQVVGARAHVADDDCALEINLTVQNTGERAGDHSVLWFTAPPNAGQLGRPIKSLLDFERLNNIQPFQSRQVQICLNREDFQLANEAGEFGVVPGEWKLLVGNLERTILVV